MDDLPRILETGRALLAAGEPAVLATLVHVVGSSYRPVGAMMLAGLGVPRVGGVSGGCLEDYVAREGLALARAGHAAVWTFDTSYDGDDPRPAPGCRGTLHVLVEPWSSRHLDLLQTIAATLADDQCVGLITEITGDQPGATRVGRTLTGDPGGDRLSHAPDPPTWRLEQRLAPPVRLVLFGAGDDAVALVRQAKLLGWHVTVLDRRARLATRDRFRDADVVLTGDWPTLLEQVGPSSAVVLMTHSVPDDAAVLGPLLARRPRYAGLLGPRHRLETVLDDVAQAGHPRPTAEQLQHLHSPVGLDLGHKSPAAIAVAIAAEVLLAVKTSAR